MKNLEQLKETYKKLWEEIKELENPKIDFSKWIGRSGTILCIKWEKNLFSYIDWEILYSNMSIWNNEEEIHYEHTILGKLKEWDVFICECDLNYILLEFFYIYKWKGSNSYVFQHLSKYSWIERIDYKFSENWKKKVIKFLRN